MSDQTSNAVVAVALGSAVAVVLLLPVAAVVYRRVGRLRAADLLLLFAAVVYAVSLWSYTLLPTPSAGDYTCARTELDPLAVWDRIDRSGGVLALVGDVTFLQLALNVLLFAPLGYFVRRVLRRGVLTATALGLGVSALVEATQLTGLWGIYDCAYRAFDVADLIANTVGAAVGSLASVLVVDRDAVRAPRPARVTLGRRLTGMASDLLFVVLAGSVVALALRAREAWTSGDPAPFLAGLTGGEAREWLPWLVPLVLEAASVLMTGRTVGERVVAVRPVARRRWLAPFSRIVKLAAGVGGLFALVAVQAWWGYPALVGFVALTVLAAARTEEHRGLSHALAGMELRVERHDEAPVAREVDVDSDEHLTPGA